MAFGVKSVTGATVFQIDDSGQVHGSGNVSIVGTDGSSALASGKIVFASASDSNVKVHVEQNGEDAIITIGVYYKVKSDNEHH